MTHSEQQPTQKNEDLVADPGIKPPTANPFAHSANITVSVPESVEIKLVDASALADYEVWVVLTSILGSAVTGFLVAVIQAPENTDRRSVIAMTIVFLLLALVCAAMAVGKRRRLARRTKRVRFRVGEPISDDPAA